jgi:hypothetical protein
VVVAGCVPQGAPKTGFLHGLSVVGVQQIDRVVEVVEETLKGTRYKEDSLTGLMKYCYQRLPSLPFFLKKGSGKQRVTQNSVRVSYVNARKKGSRTLFRLTSF